MITTTLETATLVTTLDTSDSLATGIDNATYSAIVAGGDTIVTEAMGAPGARGEKGDKGDKGDASTVPGPKGETGAGVPSGGSTGQYLRKSGNADFAFTWGTLDVGTAAAADTGISGHRLGFLDASNFYSANQYYSGGRTFLHNDAGSSIESYGSQLNGLKPLKISASTLEVDAGLYARSFVTVAGDVSPVAPNTNALGDPTYRWRNVYAVGANISGTAQLGEVIVQPSSGNGRLTIKPALGGAVYSILDLKGADNTTALEIDAGAAGCGLYSNSYRFSSADATKLYATLDSSGLAVSATGKLRATASNALQAIELYTDANSQSVIAADSGSYGIDFVARYAPAGKFRFFPRNSASATTTIDLDGVTTNKLVADTITSSGRLLANNGFTAYGDINLGGAVSAQGLTTTFGLVAGNGFTAYGDIRLSGPVSTFGDATIGGSLSVTGSHISAPSYTPLFIQRFGGDVTISGYGSGVTRVNGEKLVVYGGSEVGGTLLAGTAGIRPAARFGNDYSGVTGPFYVGDGAVGPGPLNFSVTNAGAMTATSATINGPMSINYDGGGGLYVYNASQSFRYGGWQSVSSGSYLDSYSSLSFRNNNGSETWASLSKNTLRFGTPGTGNPVELVVQGQNPNLILRGDTNSYYPAVRWESMHGTSEITGYGGLYYASASDHGFYRAGVERLRVNAGGTIVRGGLTITPTDNVIADTGIVYNASNYYIFTQWNIGFNSHNYQSAYSTQVGGFGTIYRGAGHLFRSGDDNNKLVVDTGGVHVFGGLRLASDSPPASPANGTVWTTAEGLFVRINGVTFKANLTAA